MLDLVHQVEVAVQPAPGYRRGIRVVVKSLEVSPGTRSARGRGLGHRDPHGVTFRGWKDLDPLGQRSVVGIGLVQLQSPERLRKLVPAGRAGVPGIVAIGHRRFPQLDGNGATRDGRGESTRRHHPAQGRAARSQPPARHPSPACGKSPRTCRRRRGRHAAWR